VFLVTLRCSDVHELSQLSLIFLDFYLIFSSTGIFKKFQLSIVSDIKWKKRFSTKMSNENTLSSDSDPCALLLLLEPVL
jgi:hypothetical protein